ncbi:MAG: PEP-CTERM sorting domain-containing protein [Limisphaerales bacterium]
MTINKFTPTIDARLTAYAALATVALAAPVAAKADIVYSGLLNLNVPANIDGVYLNFVTGLTGTSAGAVPGASFNPYLTGTGLAFFWNNPTGVTTSAGVSLDGGTTFAALAANSLISAGSTFFSSAQSAATPAWRAGTDAYLGVRFVNSSTLAVNYGWVHLTTTGTTGFPATIVGYAYENTGASILAGQVSPVPEPSTYALLGMMATGAFAVRRWRKQAA